MTDLVEHAVLSAAIRWANARHAALKALKDGMQYPATGPLLTELGSAEAALFAAVTEVYGQR